MGPAAGAAALSGVDCSLNRPAPTPEVLEPLLHAPGAVGLDGEERLLPGPEGLEEVGAGRRGLRVLAGLEHRVDRVPVHGERRDPGPPRPVPVGSPVWIMKSAMTR